MNFDKLFNQVFITEQEVPEATPGQGVPEAPAEQPVAPAVGGEATPDNYDVEPNPVVTPAGNAESLKTFITKIEEFADSLNSVENDSLQKLVNDLDRQGSLFQGISRETSKDIIRIAEQLTGLSEIIKGFVINSAKRSRDIAASTNQ
jgi:hypothetical protein